MNRIKKLCKKYKLFLIEDCALAPGARINGIHVGLHGDAGVFSFYPVKHLFFYSLENLVFFYLI